MNYIWEVSKTGTIILEVILMAVLYGTVFFAFFKTIKRRLPLFVVAASFVISFLSYLLTLKYLFIINVSIFVGFCIITVFYNLGVFRQFLANPFKRSKTSNKGKFEIEKPFDKENVYKAVEAAVLSFSQQKIGAIITFEKNTVLTDIMKNGVYVQAPVTTELLQTIFYPGTRLHDGAVIIQKDKIVAASVFFTPTARVISGKYGSRHRAALGISEVSDAITVVVSEETGRISIAANGELEAVSINNFLRVFENYMDSVKGS